MVYSNNRDELEIIFNKALQKPLVKQFPKFVNYLHNLYERRQEWALCVRKGLITRGQNTNNISEAGMKIIKDVILDRTKAYSPVQLFFFIVIDLDAFYEIKLLDVAANRPPQYLKKTNLSYKTSNTDCTLFEVYNKLHNTQYTVDLDHGICSCPQGNRGFPCKHQVFIANDKNIDIICLPTNVETRKKLHIIATGSSDIKSGWYGSSKNENSNINKLDIETNKINRDTMYSNKQLNYQETEINEDKKIIEENQFNNSLEITTTKDFENARTDFNEVIEKMK